MEYLMSLSIPKLIALFMVITLLCGIGISYAIDGGIEEEIRALKSVDLSKYEDEMKELKARSVKAAKKYEQQMRVLQEKALKEAKKHEGAVAKMLELGLEDLAQKFKGNKYDDGSFEKYVFISLAMPKWGLISLLQQAKELGFVPVLRGFKEGSFSRTEEYLSNIIDTSQYGIIVDPALFKEFDITVVPSYVITKKEEVICRDNMSCMSRRHNKLTGNVTISYANKLLLSKGEEL